MAVKIKVASDVWAELVCQTEKASEHENPLRYGSVSDVLIEHEPNLPAGTFATCCRKCGRSFYPKCNGNGWLDAIGPCRDGSYITSRPCPND